MMICVVSRLGQIFSIKTQHIRIRDIVGLHCANPIYDYINNVFLRGLCASVANLFWN